MYSNELKKILSNLNDLGNNIFLEGVDENSIIDFEVKHKIKFPYQLKAFYLFSDGGEFFLPAGVQLYGISHAPVIDFEDDDKPSEDYIIIGTLSNGDPVLYKQGSENIYIYNHESGVIENDEIYPDFFTFLKDLPNILGL